MSRVSFDLFRTLGLQDCVHIKPSRFFESRSLIEQAEWVLFPEYWQVNALVFGLNRRIFPSLPSYLIGHDKIEMTRAFLTVAPAHVPETRIAANTPFDAEEIWREMSLPFVAKLPRSSQGEGVWKIETRADWQAYVARGGVLYAQEYLPIDRDIRVVVVGREVLGAYWRLQSPYGFHNNLARGGEARYEPVPAAATDLALKVARLLGVDHAGFDIAMVGDHPYLLEFNRLFGHQGIEGGGARVREAIAAHLDTQSRPERPVTPRQGGGRRRLRRAA